MQNYNLYDRILGSLTLAGIGDAIGAPSEAMSRDEIQRKYGGRITTFLDGSDNPYALGNAVGEVTDDASQMYEMALAIIRTGGELTAEAAAEAILNWSRNFPRYYPRNAGPTTRHVITELLEGKDPIEIGMTGCEYNRGVSNGAAMRVAGAGLAHPGDWERAARTAIASCRPSHGTQQVTFDKEPWHPARLCGSLRDCLRHLGGADGGRADQRRSPGLPVWRGDRPAGGGGDRRPGLRCGRQRTDPSGDWDWL